jgi:GLPGLI family protein
MKKILLIIGLLVSIFAAYTLSAQSEGKIAYEIKVNMHRTLPPGREDMKQMMPEFNIHHDLLVYKGNESYYTPVEDEPEEEEIQDGAMHMRFRRPMSEYYFNIDQSAKIVQREFFGKQYLIKDTIRIHPWKLSDETKTIQGYVCKSASFVDPKRKQKVVAWYTEQIRPFLGPESFNTLPGTVLQVDINDGERIVTAEKIEFGTLAKDELRIPTKGTKVTEEEFTKIVDETHKKMGGPDQVIIRTN